MSNIKVSVIIPVYNAEKYIKQCLNSVVNQTLKNIEIICINDSSEDNSLLILEEYSKRDGRILIVDNKENIGGGFSRNKGLKVAKGEYISFIDADDWVENNMLEYTYNEAMGENLDLLLFLAKNFDDETKEIYENDYYNIRCWGKLMNNRIFRHDEVESSIFCLPVSPWLKLYKKEFLDNINAVFPKERVMHDNPFFFNVFLKAQRIKLIRKYFYYRRRHESSLINMREKWFWDIIPISNLIVDAFKKNKVFDKYKESAINRKVFTIRSEYDKMDEKYQRKFFKEIVNEFSKISNDFNQWLDYLFSLDQRNLFFYMNIIKSKSFHDFTKLNEISNLRMDNNDLKEKKENEIIKKENKALKNKIKRIESSNSWKITKPIRKITSFFRH